MPHYFYQPMDTTTIDVTAQTVDLAIAPAGQLATPPPRPSIVLPPTRGDLRRLIASGQNLGWRRPLSETEADLFKPLPPALVSWLPGKRGGEPIPFISWPDANMILSFITPGWQVQFDEGQLGNIVTIRCKLTLLCAEGEFTRSSLGSEGLEDEYFGGPLPDAESQAFRRAAARFGLGLYLYDADVRKAMINKRGRR